MPYSLAGDAIAAFHLQDDLDLHGHPPVHRNY